MDRVPPVGAQSVHMTASILRGKSMTDNHKHPPGREPPDLPPKPEPEPDTKSRRV